MLVFARYHSGEPASSREDESTAGELLSVKDRSRERSETDRAIDDGLARRVACGELIIEEKLLEHRRQDDECADDTVD